MTNEVDMLLQRRTGCEIDLVEMVFQNKQADNPAGIVPSKKSNYQSNASLTTYVVSLTLIFSVNCHEKS